MYRQYIRGRNRILDPEQKVKLCQLVRESATIEEAAEALDVSLRTVQRERKGDEDFDHELRLALQAPPDPKKLMQSAARTHWRAAAWLLERTEPETYARKSANTAYATQVTAALEAVVEAALEAVPPQLRTEVYRHVHAASERAFDCCFPNLGPWGNPRNPKHAPTPLRDEQERIGWSGPGHLRYLDDYEVEPDETSVDEFIRRSQAYSVRKETAPLPARAAAQQRRSQPRCHAPRRDPSPSETPAASTPDPRLSWRYALRTAQTTAPPQSDGVDHADGTDANGILSPKTRFAPEFSADAAPSEGLTPSAPAANGGPQPREGNPTNRRP